jgi:hypothetical protein
MVTVAFRCAKNKHGVLKAANMVVTDGHNEATHSKTQFLQASAPKVVVQTYTGFVLFWNQSMDPTV